jgi:hypothetical protein
MGEWDRYKYCPFCCVERKPNIEQAPSAALETKLKSGYIAAISLSLVNVMNYFKNDSIEL